MRYPAISSARMSSVRPTGAMVSCPGPPSRRAGGGLVLGGTLRGQRVLLSDERRVSQPLLLNRDHDTPPGGKGIRHDPRIANGDRDAELGIPDSEQDHVPVPAHRTDENRPGEQIRPTRLRPLQELTCCELIP